MVRRVGLAIWSVGLRSGSLAVLLAGLAVSVATGPLADSSVAPGWDDPDRPYDRARRAVERGEALPAAAILERLRALMQGDVVAMEYEFEFERWVYEFRIVDPDGRLKVIHLDAASGELVKISDD